MAKIKYDYLVIDIGSTYTKQRLFKDGLLVATVQSPTTIDDVYQGIKSGRDLILQDLQGETLEVEHVLATSSAAGGLRMVAMGYMVRVTAKAAKEVAMNAGARVLEIISQEDPPDYRIQILKEINPDIILLAGGTDGGDETSVAENAALIVQSGIKALVVVAGNVNAQPAAAKILKTGGLAHVLVPNIMPTIHQLKVKEAREAIHREFIKQITRAQGMKRLHQEITNDKVLPTPGAVLIATELLGQGTREEKGFGDVVVVDLGGATTDIHSVVPGFAELEDEEIGLIVSNEKQVSYRTVEGNLGLRVSARGILDCVSTKGILHKRGIKCEDAERDFCDYCRLLEHETGYVPQTQQEQLFDDMLAQTAIEIALKRHAGYITQDYDPIMGTVPGMPVGRDLRRVKKIIGVGGFFSHRKVEESKKIIVEALKDPGFSLLPIEPEILIDKAYILYAAGAISQWDEDYAFQILKNYFSF